MVALEGFTLVFELDCGAPAGVHNGTSLEVPLVVTVGNRFVAGDCKERPEEAVLRKVAEEIEGGIKRFVIRIAVAIVVA